jgi:hypothetical protein
MHSHWGADDLAKFRAALMQMRDPTGRYQMHVDDVPVVPHERARKPEDRMAQYFGNSTDWTGDGRLGGKRRK